MKRAIAVLALLVSFTSLALAHGKEKHVMGTVTGIGQNSITVETTAQKTVTVNVSEKTKFTKSGEPASLNDLKVGDKVVIHAGQSGDKLVATQVQFGATKSMEGMKGMDKKQGTTHSH